jgi:hypothetical protein
MSNQHLLGVVGGFHQSKNWKEKSFEITKRIHFNFFRIFFFFGVFLKIVSFPDFIFGAKPSNSIFLYSQVQEIFQREYFCKIPNWSLA